LAVSGTRILTYLLLDQVAYVAGAGETTLQLDDVTNSLASAAPAAGSGTLRINFE
jgi:hypothetical protein